MENKGLTKVSQPIVSDVLVRKYESSSLDSLQGISAVTCRPQQKAEEQSCQPDLCQKDNSLDDKLISPNLELLASQPEIHLNHFSKRVVQEWKDECVGLKFYSMSPVSSHENSLVSEEGLDPSEIKSLENCMVDSESSSEMCQEVFKNDEIFRLMAPSERIYRRAVLNYRTERRHSLLDTMRNSSFVPLLSKQEKQGNSSEDGLHSSHSKPVLEIPFWSNRCRRAVSLTLSHDDLAEDLECICSQGGSSFVDMEASSEGVSGDKWSSGRRHTRHSEGSSGGFYSMNDNRQLHKEDDYTTSHTGNSRYDEDRSSFKKRFREMFRASKHRGFICCVYCGTECWAPNGRYHFNSCKIYNASRVDEMSKRRDGSDSSGNMRSSTHHSDTSRWDSQHVSVKRSRFRHWSEAARVEGFKKTLDRPGYVVCLQCGEHVWAPNSRRHASVCFLTNETQTVSKRSRRRCSSSDKQDCVASKEAFSMMDVSEAQTSSNLSLTKLEKDQECLHNGDSESSLSKNQETDDFLICTEQKQDYEKYSGENSQVSNATEWNGYPGGSDESKQRESSLSQDFCSSSNNKCEMITANFRRCTTRKGWLECHRCQSLVWPPNALRHIRNCEK
ncbi:hypothetical protein GAYE_SCF37G5152 [Galdieria yellowstonensis]|uniref:Uncharacterized protein n=1 Tax=Galdieria yellowstonensis TaxID=3028027 RepID=A0AAV9IIE2_9RHOD|nr:hypothetical protein GAYE_SCF37G5152 [Galdieria yellowstonensis]